MVQPADPGQGSPETVGQGERIVKQGETVLSIADETGHLWETIWNHPENADLKEKRGSPHVLCPDDKIHVPPMESKEEPGSTEQRHRFRLLGQPIDFEIEVCEDGEPRAGEPYILQIERRAYSDAIPENGVIVAKMYPSDRRGELTVGEGDKEEKYPLRFGHLDPAHTQSGALARLQNLGYGASDGFEEVLADALRHFQAKHNDLTITGELDDETARALVAEHGS